MSCDVELDPVQEMLYRRGCSVMHTTMCVSECVCLSICLSVCVCVSYSCHANEFICMMYAVPSR